MLEIKDLRKIYKTNKGAPVHALDGVTLRFPETGMVFLLGKSGSGKSTLLNVCGGLDSPTDGEIIVKGRSSRDFSQSDFDSYRNTFIGFIFQEYNILNEFSVEDNIALALELQGKPKDKAAIQKLLEEVDLQGYAKRKPNTLSGGQKQRIAIARALIKTPEIIMADEPTGALDSNTGKQVLETLKKLSATKLVIVVSHDRDFAEYYGDRIIELSDGKVISDISKAQEAQQQLTANVNAVGDVLCVKNGAELTDADFAQIKAFLQRTGNNAIIAGGEKDVANFKKVSRISDDGTKEVFRDTAQPAAKSYTNEESRFIRSKLPIRHAAKIGTSSLKTKPFRLFFTILLCTVAFTMFSLLSTLNFYNSHATFLQTMRDTNTAVVQMVKYYKTVHTGYENGEQIYQHDGYNQTKFTESERKEYSALLGTDAFGIAENYGNFNLRQNNIEYWQNTIFGMGLLPADHSLRQQITGEYPKTADEMVISSYMADMLIACKAYDSEGNSLELTERNQVIGKKFTVNGVTYTVTGILDSGEIPAKFDPLKESTEPDYNLRNEFNSYLGDGLHLLAFVNQERLETLSAQSHDYYEKVENYTSVVTGTKQDGEYQFPEWSDSTYSKVSDLDGSEILFVSGKNAVGDNEVVLPYRFFAEKIRNAYYTKRDQQFDKEDMILRYDQAIQLVDEIAMGGKFDYENMDKDGKDEPEFIALTEEQIKDKLAELLSCVQRDEVDMTFGVKLFNRENNAAYGDAQELTIVGVYLKENTNYGNMLYLSDTAFNRLWEEQKQTVSYYSITQSNYKPGKDAFYNKLYLPFVYSPATADTYWDIFSNEEWAADESRVALSGNFISTLDMVDNMVKNLSKIFFWVALVFAVFAILLFSNFISASIVQKKKEIGILRAVGARSADVFKIFFSESFVIALICMALSVAASIVICNLINASLAVELGASLFVFGPASFGVLTGAALVTVVIATYLPVRKAARKKPVESIRAL